jgi:RHS repeat-associated protein
MIDAKNQTTAYNYNVDNTLQQISYSNAVVDTPPVSYTYDTNYNRIVTMVDTNGTTTYTYNPNNSTVLGAGKLASVVGPLPNSTITYGYDQLGRVLNRAINSVTNAVTYDNLGRVMIVTNVLGAFTNKYVGVTARLSTTTYPNGQALTNTYFGNTGDHRLQEILNQASDGSTISKFDYAYDAEGEIQSWTQQTNSSPASVYNFQYDAASQLIDAVMNGAVATNMYSYAYDAAGNRLSERINGTVEGASYNNLNELVNQNGGSGPLRFRGSVNEPISNATVAGKAAALDSGTNFTGYATVNPGSNTVQVAVSDYNGNTLAHYYSVVLSNGASQTMAYDLNGNLVTMSNTTTGTAISNVWDAANRLVAIYSNETYTSRFTYDGFGRRVRQTEINGTTTNSDHWMLWCDKELAEERDSSGGTVTKRFYAQGEQISGVNYYFTRDHLGSIREMRVGSLIVARYDYDSWGRRAKISGGLDADFGFTGHYFHAPSGLHLALYRAYSADLGRWFSRDPVGERVTVIASGALAHRRTGSSIRGFTGVDELDRFDNNDSLYDYVGNKPTQMTDPLGLSSSGGIPPDVKKAYQAICEDCGSGGSANADDCYTVCDYLTPDDPFTAYKGWTMLWCMYRCTKCWK